MSEITEIKVPDIGDFKGVAVIEVLIKPGDALAPEDPLIVLESDKASMEVPSPTAGVVKEVKVKVGDRVSEGDLILLLEAAAEQRPSSPAPLPPAGEGSQSSPVGSVGADLRVRPDGEGSQSSPVGSVGADLRVRPDGEGDTGSPLPPEEGSGVRASSTQRTADLDCEMLVLGSGPGGYSAAFRAADLGLKTVLVERYPTLGGVCLNVGCIPSKALLHVAAVMDEAAHFADLGIVFDKPTIDLDKLRAHKAKVVSKLTGGLAGMAKARKVETVRGYGHFLDPHHLEVELTTSDGQDKTGEKKVVRFEKCIIAAGSQAVHLPFLPDDPRIIDSTGALELRFIPKRLLVIGGGIIGLEMATVFSTLGARIEVVEMLDALMQGPDRDLVKVWQKMNAHRFDRIMLKTKTVAVEAKPEGLLVTFEGDNAPAEPQLYDMILQSVGRTPNGKKIGAENVGITVTDRGFIPVDKQMRTNVPHIFAIGDLIGQPMLAHKAVHEGHVAAEVAAGQKSFFDAKVIPGVAYTDPEVAWVGLTEAEAKAQGVQVGVGKFPWAASGRAIANNRDEGFTKLIFDEDTHRIVGGGIVGTHAGDLIGEVALAIEMGCDPADIGLTIHPHPTLGESVGMAAEVFEGTITDLYIPRKKK